MKTAKRNTVNFPRTGRFSLYLCAVVVLCFLNWVALHAQAAPKAGNSKSLLVIALTEENESPVSLQDWMLDFEKEYLAENGEPELRVEPWMLSFAPDCSAGTDESEINFEPWMVNFEQRCLVVDEEQDFPLECWMVCTRTWECDPDLLARK